MKKALIVFVRKPEKGKVKTRLAASIGEDAALEIYVRLLEHTKSVTDSVAADKFIFYADEISLTDMWQGQGYHKLQQENGDLGVRMQAAFMKLFAKGYEQLLIIGSDCPELSKEHIENGFSFLQNVDVVIGPAADGGYYLLGLKRMYPELFLNKQWSTGSVFAYTMETVSSLNLKVKKLPVLNDVDEYKDVPAGWLLNQNKN